MSEHTWATNDVPPGDQFNEDLMRQTIIRCTSSTRGSTWLGKHIYETDRDLHWYHDGDAWVLQPKPVYKRKFLSTGDPGYYIGVEGEIELNGSAMPGQFYSAVEYKLHWEFMLLGDAATNVWVIKVLRDGSPISGIRERNVYITATGIQIPVVITEFDIPTTGPHTYSLSIDRGAGSGHAEVPAGTPCYVEAWQAA